MLHDSRSEAQDAARDAYNETIVDELEFFRENPRFRVEPWGPGGPSVEVGELGPDLQVSCAVRIAETTANRVLKEQASRA